MLYWDGVDLKGRFRKGFLCGSAAATAASLEPDPAAIEIIAGRAHNGDRCSWCKTQDACPQREHLHSRKAFWNQGPWSTPPSTRPAPVGTPPTRQGILQKKTFFFFKPFARPPSSKCGFPTSIALDNSRCPLPFGLAAKALVGFPRLSRRTELHQCVRITKDGRLLFTTCLIQMVMGQEDSQEIFMKETNVYIEAVSLWMYVLGCWS